MLQLDPLWIKLSGMFSLPVCICMNGPSADTYKLMQYANMKAVLYQKDLVHGVGRAVSQCCLCLVRSIMWLGTPLKILFSYIEDYSLHLSLFCKCLRWHVHSSSLVAMHLMLQEQRMFTCALQAITSCLTNPQFRCQMISGYSSPIGDCKASLKLQKRSWSIATQQQNSELVFLVYLNRQILDDVKWLHKLNWVSVTFLIKNVACPLATTIFFCSYIFVFCVYIYFFTPFSPLQVNLNHICSWRFFFPVKGFKKHILTTLTRVLFVDQIHLSYLDHFLLGCCHLPLSSGRCVLETWNTHFQNKAFINKAGKIKKN